MCLLGWWHGEWYETGHSANKPWCICGITINYIYKACIFTSYIYDSARCSAGIFLTFISLHPSKQKGWDGAWKQGRSLFVSTYKTYDVVIFLTDINTALHMNDFIYKAALPFLHIQLYKPHGDGKAQLTHVHTVLESLHCSFIGVVALLYTNGLIN